MRYENKSVAGVAVLGSGPVSDDRVSHLPHRAHNPTEL
jgi:hypothetical protein